MEKKPGKLQCRLDFEEVECDKERKVGTGRLCRERCQSIIKKKIAKRVAEDNESQK